MIESAKQLHESTSANHRNVYVLANTIRDKVGKDLAEDLPEMADIIYALNECGKLQDDAAKIMRGLKTHLEKLVCAIVVRDGTAGRIETPYCAAQPNIKMALSLPARSTKPELFMQMMRALNIPETLLGDGDTMPECVRLHYPGVVEMISAKLAAGEPLPEGLSEAVKQFPEFRVKITSRKGVQEQ